MKVGSGSGLVVGVAGGVGRDGVRVRWCQGMEFEPYALNRIDQSSLTEGRNDEDGY